MVKKTSKWSLNVYVNKFQKLKSAVGHIITNRWSRLYIFEWASRSQSCIELFFQGLESVTKICWVPKWMPSTKWSFITHHNFLWWLKWDANYEYLTILLPVCGYFVKTRKCGTDGGSTSLEGGFGIWNTPPLPVSPLCFIWWFKMWAHSCFHCCAFALLEWMQKAFLSNFWELPRHWL